MPRRPVVEGLVRSQRVVGVAEAADLDGQGVAVADHSPIQALVLQRAEEPLDHAVGLWAPHPVRTWRNSGSSPVNASANTVPRKHGPLWVTTAIGAGASPMTNGVQVLVKAGLAGQADTGLHGACRCSSPPSDTLQIVSWPAATNGTEETERYGPNFLDTPPDPAFFANVRATSDEPGKASCRACLEQHQRQSYPPLTYCCAGKNRAGGMRDRCESDHADHRGGSEPDLDRDRRFLQAEDRALIVEAAATQGTGI